MKKQKTELIDLLKETAEAHHQAFAETNGEDKDWAKWYSEFMKDQLNDLLDSEIVPEQLTDELTELDKRFNSKWRTLKWTEFYADNLIGKYASDN